MHNIIKVQLNFLPEEENFIVSSVCLIAQMRLLTFEGDETLDQIHPHIDNYNKENFGNKMYILPVSLPVSLPSSAEKKICTFFLLKYYLTLLLTKELKAAC